MREVLASPPQHEGWYAARHTTLHAAVAKQALHALCEAPRKPDEEFRKALDRE